MLSKSMENWRKRGYSWRRLYMHSTFWYFGRQSVDAPHRRVSKPLLVVGDRKQPTTSFVKLGALLSIAKLPLMIFEVSWFGYIFVVQLQMNLVIRILSTHTFIRFWLSKKLPAFLNLLTDRRIAVS